MADLSCLKKACRATLDVCPVGTGPDNIQHGKDFYKFMFGNHPALRKYFKGAENYSPEDVQGSERFEKQGQRILLAMHVVADTIDDPVAFKAYARETVNRHRQYKMEDGLWAAFFPVFIAYLGTKATLTAEQTKAWEQVGALFAEECAKHLASFQK